MMKQQRQLKKGVCETLPVSILVSQMIRREIEGRAEDETSRGRRRTDVTHWKYVSARDDDDEDEDDE